jgi:hypothetical protein
LPDAAEIIYIDVAQNSQLNNLATEQRQEVRFLSNLRQSGKVARSINKPESTSGNGLVEVHVHMYKLFSISLMS